MSRVPIATISDGESPELWMGKLEACRQAADAARDASLIGEVSQAKLAPTAEEEIPDEYAGGGGAAAEPSAVAFDDDSD